MNTFTKGLGVFWRTELCPAIRSLIMFMIEMVIIGTYLIDVVALCLNVLSVRTPSLPVWFLPGSAMLWLISIGYVLVKHITRLGREADNVQ